MNEYLNDFKQTQWFENIQKQIQNNTFSHSHLVMCDDEFSAKIFAKLIAQTLLCSKKTACNQCAGCLQTQNEVHADLFVFPKGNSFVVADSSLIVEKAYTKPIFADRKVFLIYDFDSANTASQNKILKILEEPTPNTYFVLCAKNLQKILPTIKSRMQIISLPAFSENKLKEILSSHGKTPTDALLTFSQGYLGKAISLLDNDFLNSYDFVVNMLKNMKSSKDVIKFTSKMADKNSFLLKMEILEYVMRNILLLSQNSALLSPADALVTEGLDREFSVGAILQIEQKILQAKAFFDANVNLNTICDNLLVGILEVKFLWK